MKTCGYKMADGEICAEPISEAEESPSGYVHNNQAAYCHWASPVNYGPQDADAVVVKP
jgi:hypothetical protein